MRERAEWIFSFPSYVAFNGRGVENSFDSTEICLNREPEYITFMGSLESGQHRGEKKLFAGVETRFRERERERAVTVSKCDLIETGDPDRRT